MYNSKRKVLHILGSLNVGGAETMVMNVYRGLDQNRVQFDFLVNGLEKGYYEGEIEERHGKIYHVSRKSECYWKYLKEMYSVVHRNSYEITHIHSENSFLAFVDLVICKLAGTKRVVVHSHTTMDYRGGKLAKLSPHFSKILNRCADVKVSCGSAAAIWLFGQEEGVEIIPLPVDCEKYRLAIKKQNELKQKNDLLGCTVYAHTGSFSKVKNHKFLIEVFSELCKINPKSHLILMGDGELRPEIEQQICDMKLQNRITLYGVVSDIDEKLALADYFIFPSLFEGFPTAVLEAQAAGLNCFLSNTITEKVAISDLVHFMSLKDDAKKWAHDIALFDKNSLEKRLASNLKIADRYDTKKVIEVFYRLYNT